MTSINPQTREIILKVVYYGPGLCGKTTSLRAIHSAIPNERRPEMVSVETDEDRTLFFDFLPVDVARLGTYSIRLLVYTVPGQVYYNSTRKLVLNGADGVIFVADSQKERHSANLESFSNLEVNLAEWGLELKDVPHVLQLNKRDLPGVMPSDKMAADLNRYNVPWFETNAVTGDGVQEAVLAITQLIIRDLQKQRKAKKGAPEESDGDSDSGSENDGDDKRGASSIAESIVQQLPTEPPKVGESSGAAKSDFSLSTCWPGDIMRAEAASVETLIGDGDCGQAVIKAAQLLNSLALRSGHAGREEAVFAMLHGVTGHHYLRFRGLVTQALRADPVSLEDALWVYMLASKIAAER